jgi:outer membrane protein OmpA-like peptidoglycan-associated protein
MAYADIFHEVDIPGTTLKDSYEERREASRPARAYVEAEALAGPANPSCKASVPLDRLVERRDTFANHSGGGIVIRRLMIVACLGVLALVRPAAALADDQGPGHDYAPFAAIDGTKRDRYQDIRFDYFNFVGDDTGKKIRVEGHKIVIRYDRDDSVSGLETLRTVVEQAKSVNAQITFQHGDTGTIDAELLDARFERDGKQVWIQVQYWDNNITDYTIVEEQSFQPQTHLSETDLRRELETTGKAVLYVNFAFNRAQLLPDAMPIIQEVVSVMKTTPDLKLDVDGHTDGIGSADYNQKLSEARAAAVVASLTAAGIDPGRLKPAGFGASQPIADNDSAQGRAENRRVELVRQ